MNRAILIVICDFLVSAMLAMMTGMVPAHTGGTGVGLDETTTKQLLLDLDNSRTELEKLRAKLREAVESFGLTPEREAELRRISALLAANKLQRDLLTGQTGKVTPDKLQLELAAEKEARAALEQRLAAQQQELESTRHNLQEEKNRTRDYREDIAINRRELQQARRTVEKVSMEVVNLSKRNTELSRTINDQTRQMEQQKTAHSREKAQLQQEHTRAISEEQKKTALAIQETQHEKEKLSRVRSELTTRTKQLSGSQGENIRLRHQLGIQQGKSAEIAKNAAETKDENERLRREAEIAKLKAAEYQAQNQGLERIVKSTVKQLSDTQNQLDDTRTKLDKINAANAQELQKAVAKLSQSIKSAAPAAAVIPVKKVNYIDSYTNSVVQFDYAITEDGMLRKRVSKARYFLPAVNFNGRVLLPGSFKIFGGDSSKLPFAKVLDVNYTLLPYSAAKVSPRKITGNIMLNPRVPGLAALEYVAKDRTPLPVIHYQELTKRGLDDLHLFKCRTFGQENALLERSRLSISATPAAPQLLIRNPKGALAADEGDFVMTSDGKFAGTVIYVRSNVAIAALVNTGDVWNAPGLIPLYKGVEEKEFRNFAAKMLEWHNKLTASPGRK